MEAVTCHQKILHQPLICGKMFCQLFKKCFAKCRNCQMFTTQKLPNVHHSYCSHCDILTYQRARLTFMTSTCVSSGNEGVACTACNTCMGNHNSSSSGSMVEWNRSSLISFWNTGRHVDMNTVNPDNKFPPKPRHNERIQKSRLIYVHISLNTDIRNKKLGPE